MQPDRFWRIIENSKSAGPRHEMATIRMALRALDPTDVADFGRYVDECLDALYTWDLWAVATSPTACGPPGGRSSPKASRYTSAG